MTQVTPNDILKTYPVFKVCTQVKPTDSILIRQVRCPDIKELMEFMKRLMKPVQLGELSFFEVHKINADGTVQVVLGDVNKPWPKVKEEKIGGIISPRIPQPDSGVIVVDATNPKAPSTIVQKLLALRAGQPTEDSRPIKPRETKEA